MTHSTDSMFTQSPALLPNGFSGDLTFLRSLPAPEPTRALSSPSRQNSPGASQGLDNVSSPHLHSFTPSSRWESCSAFWSSRARAFKLFWPVATVRHTYLASLCVINAGTFFFVLFYFILKSAGHDSRSWFHDRLMSCDPQFEKQSWLST